MSLFNVGLGQTQTINQSGTDTVSFLGLGTLDIVGAPANPPINVLLSQVGGAGLLDTMNISNANVTLAGVAGVSALVNYNIAGDSTLTLASTANVNVGSEFTFTAPNSELALGNGLNLSLSDGIAGFAPGSTIDVGAVATSVDYADAAGTGTGGTLTLLNDSGQAVETLSLTTGEYTAGEFRLSADGNGGTLVNLGIAVSGVAAMPATGDLGPGRSVMLDVSTSAPVTVSGGTPTLTLNDGGTATFDPAASTASTLAFQYTVAPGQNAPDLGVLGVLLNGATLTGMGGVPVDLSGAIGNMAGTVQIDTIRPTVIGVTTDPGSGMVRDGQTVAVDVDVSEPVTVAGGTPSLALSDGGTATYDPSASTPTMLMFMHTVQAGQSTSDLSVLGIDTNGASVSDGAGNMADLSGAIMNPPGILATNGNSNVSVQTQTPSTLGVYRFFDSSTGTHFFTADASEKNALMNPSLASYRPDLVEEVNNFGAIDPNAGDPNEVTVYRFFDTAHGTHFFTASQSEANGLKDPSSPDYRPDLVFEPGSSFEEHGTQQAGDVAVYRFFDQTYGTHFYTGSQAEYAGITTPGTAAFRPDLVSEGVGFYAPPGSFA